MHPCTGSLRPLALKALAPRGQQVRAGPSDYDKKSEAAVRADLRAENRNTATESALTSRHSLDSSPARAARVRPHAPIPTATATNCEPDAENPGALAALARESFASCGNAFRVAASQTISH